jgi:hypothetical protein
LGVESEYYLNSMYDDELEFYLCDLINSLKSS